MCHLYVQSCSASAAAIFSHVEMSFKTPVYKMLDAQLTNWIKWKQNFSKTWHKLLHGKLPSWKFKYTFCSTNHEFAQQWHFLIELIVLQDTYYNHKSLKTINMICLV